MPNFIFRRNTQIKTTLDLAWDNVADPTHFIWLHHKHFKRIDILYNDGENQNFYYESLILYPLPIKKKYISYRKMDHKNYKFYQVYKDLNSDNLTFFHCFLTEDNGTVTINNQMSFDINGIIANFPKLVSLLWNRRLNAMWLEDEELLMQREKMGGFDNPNCLPKLNSLDEILNNEAEAILAQEASYVYNVPAKESLRK